MSGFDELKPKCVLGVAAHADDLEYGAAGTMAKFIQQGADVYYLIVTDGSKGSKDRAMTPEKMTQIRHDEQLAAGKILGLKDVFFLDYKDGMLENTMDLKRDIVRVIRTVQPDVVVTMDPSLLYDAGRGFINHPDHRAVGQATLDAVYPLARDHMSFPELLAEGLEPHKTATVLLINFKQHNFAVDITKTMPLKIKALEAHASQISDRGISTLMQEWDAEFGAQYGFEYAELFVRIDIT